MTDLPTRIGTDLVTDTRLDLPEDPLRESFAIGSVPVYEPSSRRFAIVLLEGGSQLDVVTLNSPRLIRSTAPGGERSVIDATCYQNVILPSYYRKTAGMP